MLYIVLNGMVCTVMTEIWARFLGCSQGRMLKMNYSSFRHPHAWSSWNGAWTSPVTKELSRMSVSLYNIPQGPLPRNSSACERSSACHLHVASWVLNTICEALIFPWHSANFSHGCLVNTPCGKVPSLGLSEAKRIPDMTFPVSVCRTDTQIPL